VPDAASYAPVTVLIDERADGVHVSYDLVTSFLAPDRNAQASAVAAQLDEKIVSLFSSGTSLIAARDEAHLVDDREPCGCTHRHDGDVYTGVIHE
jgi:hypothetical protein